MKNILFVICYSICGMCVMGALCFVSDKRGPGPDYDIQQGFNQPISDFGENARRIILKSLPTSGHLLWGSSFDEGISEIEITGVGPIGEWTDKKTNSGGGAIRLSTNNFTGSYTAARRLCAPSALSKIGASVFGYPEIDMSGSSLEDMGITIETNFYGSTNDGYTIFSVTIARNLEGTYLEYLNEENKYIRTDYSFGDFFVNTGDPWPYTFWRNLKLVVNPISEIPRYDYFAIDGKRFDLSDLTPKYQKNPVVNRSFLFVYVFLRTSEDLQKIAYVDDFSITDLEP
jgi:hypothetical protein